MNLELNHTNPEKSSFQKNGGWFISWFGLFSLVIIPLFTAAQTKEKEAEDNKPSGFRCAFFNFGGNYSFPGDHVLFSDSASDLAIDKRPGYQFGIGYRTGKTFYFESIINYSVERCRINRQFSSTVSYVGILLSAGYAFSRRLLVSCGTEMILSYNVIWMPTSSIMNSNIVSVGSPRIFLSCTWQASPHTEFFMLYAAGSSGGGYNLVPGSGNNTYLNYNSTKLAAGINVKFFRKQLLELNKPTYKIYRR